MMERKMSPRQILHPHEKGVYRLGIFVNEASGKLFYAETNLTEENRIIPKRVYLDDDGCIQVEIERRSDDMVGTN